MKKSDIQSELKAAMMAKNERKTSTLRMLLSAIQASEVQREKHEVTEDEIMAIVSREVKRHKESIEEYQKGGREDLADQEEKELLILQHYLPQQLSSEEIETLAKEAVRASGATTAQDFGKVMKLLSQQIKGKADGRVVSDVVKKLLGS